MKPEWLNRSLFDLPCYLTLCTTPAMFEKELKRLGVPKPWPEFVLNTHSHATAHQFEKVNDTGKRTVIVCIPPDQERDQLEIVGLIVHEAVHVWQWACENIGEDKPSMEFEAYAIQRLTQNLLGEYRRQVFGV